MRRVGASPRSFRRASKPDGPSLTSGIIGLANKGQPRKPDDWGALRAWQWGVSRLIDYFETDPAVDAKQVGIEGLSRYGKAALVTEAFEPRIAVGFIGSSGEGGAKLHRHIFGETVENLTGGEYYWMAGNFMKYGASEATFGSKNAGDIPVDSHELIAMCAPRPCFVSYGVVEHGDAKWVDAHGSFMAAVAAGPAYRLLGKRDLGTPGNYLTDPMPPVGQLIGGELAWRQHSGGHSVAENWPAFVEWASQFIKSQPAPEAHLEPGRVSALALTPYNASGVYRLGDTVGWNVKPSRAEDTTGDWTYAIRRNNLDVIASGVLDLTSGSAKVEAKIDQAAMVFLSISKRGEEADPQKAIVAGAAVAPDELEPSVPRPADFEAFWSSKIEQLEAVPSNAVLTPGDSGRPGVAYATIAMDNIEGAHIRGQVAWPTRPGKFPALVMLQWASPPYPLQKDWVTSRAANGFVVINIEPHDVLPFAPPSYYSGLPDQLKHYESIGRDDRDKNYFLRMYLADYRAVDYVASRPEWDGKTLTVLGTSMGGQQSLCVAGLHPKITHVIVNEPSGCDANGPLHGRASGYPGWPADDAKAMATAPYFDAVNFASNIKATSLVAMGFVDTVAPPVGIWTAFNQIRGPKEAAPMVESPHNNLATPGEQRPFTSRSEQWLTALARGRDVSPWPLGVWPVPRTDENSRIAHEQLLEKARRGQIDVYFEGDSITRRWGSTDPQYAHLLANWRSNFFGWNAADFAWGGDTVQNVLWRLENGELDSIDPRVIVLLAGTNNIGTAPPSGPADPRIDEITAGIRAILDVCRWKAPFSTIVLIGITPRNDNPAVMPIVNEVNRRIAAFADGRGVRYLNLNDRLADADGKLFEGMSNPDKLHLEVKGYQVWADALKPILTEVLGPPSKEDHAPPPTGDPSARGARPR